MPPLRYILSPALLALAIAGCGGSSTPSTSSTTSAPPSTSSSAAAPASAPAPAAGGSSLAVAADPSGALKFSTASLHARAGTVRIAFTNQASLPHNLTIAGPSGQPVGATPTFSGGKQSLTVHLKPGTYTFFCSVPGHRTAGMQGTLTVS